MDAIYIDATDETPYVALDAEKKVFEFSGKSLPEDVVTFYQPIIDWLEEFGSNPGSDNVISFKMDYFNTASSKMILDILIKLEEIQEEHDCINVKWYFQEDDEDMEEAGEEYFEIVELPHELIATP